MNFVIARVSDFGYFVKDHFAPKEKIPQELTEIYEALIKIQKLRRKRTLNAAKHVLNPIEVIERLMLGA